MSLVATASAPATAAKRLAFVVGIDRYDNLSNDQQLKRAVADARAMTATLKDLQFEVIGGENLGREQFFVSWQRFLDAISPGDTTAVFFAGHGIEMEGSNYLMPRDVPAAAKGERVLRSSAVALTEVLYDLDKRKPGTAFVVLDACRNNPFSVSGRSIGGARGLARVDERPGTLILYSAGIGQVALDHVPGEPAATNSVFTHTLVPLLKTPGLDLLDVAKQTQRRVDALARRASHTQTPAFYSQLLTDVHLAGGAAAAVPAPTASEREAVRKAIEAERARAEAELAERVAEATRKLHEDLRKADEERKKIASATPPGSGPTTIRPPAPVPQPKSASETQPPTPAGPDPGRSIMPGSGRSFRDKLGNGRDCPSCPEMVVVSAGSFMMGSPADEGIDVEGPQHQVKIARPFAVSKFEVAFAEWDACVAAGGCLHTPSDYDMGRGRRPVINVSWDDAKEYVAWLSRTTGRGYRLLSEAEWEYAARAGTTTPFSTGRDITTDQANYSGVRSTTVGKTSEVGRYPANAWGLHDMHGNVWEWVEDCWHDNYNGAPSDGTVWTTACTDGGRRVLRGGSWASYSILLQSANRFRGPTGNRSIYIGFRVGRTPTP